MNYYIGYFNKPWDKSEFTVICKTFSKPAAVFIFEQYSKYDDAYIMLSEYDVTGLTLLY